jgi:thiol:disulfide interchange protein
MKKICLIAAALAAYVGLALGSAEARAADIYPDPDRAAADLAAALQNAAAQHRRVIVDFGGNWCTDCRVLDIYFHDPANRPLLEDNFVLVHVNVGRLDRNLDLAERLRIPIEKGVPALAVLAGDGTLLYSQKTGEFEAMRRMQSATVTQFLEQWKLPPGG